MALPIASQPAANSSLMARLKDGVAGLETLTRTPALRGALPPLLGLGGAGGGGGGLRGSAATGADLVSNLPMGESRSVEAVQLRQAQELDIARSITEITGINGARVHLALAERSAFLRDNQPPRASVFLQLAPGRVLDSAQTEAIINLVSSSVPGMARQDVTVVDQMGRLLSSGSSDPAMMASDQQMQRRLQMETIYRQRIEALLAPIVGPDNL